MLLSLLTSLELKRRLSGHGLTLQIGPFFINLRSTLPEVQHSLSLLYESYTVGEDQELTDLFLRLEASSLLRRVLRPQVTFSFDGHQPFKPLPRKQCFAMFEWGLNWCIANNAHQYLVVHSAVVAKNDRALILPGMPGAGKSTLCAGLVSQGWRLLSDEMALVSLFDGLLSPIPRPVSLKNESIGIVRNLSHDIFLGEPITGTAKGTIAHMRAPLASVEASQARALPVAVVFPRYRRDAQTTLSPFSKGRSFLTLAQNSFNYHVLGASAFDVLAGLIDGASCFEFTYHDLNDAYRIMDELVCE